MAFSNHLDFSNEIRRRLPLILYLKIGLFRAPVPLDDFNRLRAKVTQTQLSSRVANNYKDLIQFYSVIKLAYHISVEVRAR